MANAQRHSQRGKETPKNVIGSAAAAASKKRGNGKANPQPASPLSAQERWLLIAQNAYFRAERRGFAPCEEWQDWFDAEAEVLRHTWGR
jgi:hypothetical protein